MPQMKKYKCLIIDDSMMERDIMEMLISKVGRLEITAIAENGLEAQQILTSQEIDIVFSDIDMPELSGIDLLKSLKKAPVFIFVSAHPEYAIDGYNHDVIDFIVKPVSLDRVLRSANKAIEYLDLKNQSEIKQSQATIENDNYFFFYFYQGFPNSIIWFNYNLISFII